MRPRNQRERYFVGLAGKLPPITEKQRRYACDNLFEAVAVYKPRKGEVKCMCCGLVTYWDRGVVKAMAESDEYGCPGCGRQMRMKQYSPSHGEYREAMFYTVITTFRGWQVARTFDVWRCNRKDAPTKYSVNEIFQTWIDDEGKETITGRRHHRSPFSLSWDHHLPWEIKQHNSSCTGAFQMDDTFDIAGNAFYPVARVTPKLVRNGWDKGMMKYKNFFSMTDAMRWLLTVPDAEMLWKTGQKDLFLRMLRRRDMTLPYRYAVCIANRNGYIVDDAQMWMDYLGMAAELGMDTHNPKVVCPPDLKEAHDAVLRRIARIRRQKKAEKESLEAATYEESYRKLKGQYFGISFGNDAVRIAVIPSVAEIAEEGREMRHCVYQAKYFNKNDSLILSARDADGNRLETVELSLKTFKVLQSRAKFNQKSSRHEEIIRLVEENAKLFMNIGQPGLREAV